jgi:hypothetical protein
MTGADDPFYCKYDEYDYVISLGGNCATASQLVHRGKRPFALPFDYTLMTNEQPIEYLIKGFKTRFDGFMTWEEVYEFEPPAEEFGKMAFHIEDKKSNFRFIHLFYGKRFDREMFDVGKRIMMRRISRLYDVVEKSKRVLFVLQTSFTYELEIARRLRAVLVETFPGVEIELRIMQMGAENASTIIEDDGLLRFYTYPRPHNIVYDNQFTSVEWHWMDEMRVRTMCDSARLRKKSLLIKWLYKIWRNLGKRLRKKGAGCACMRFRKFGRYT